MPPSSADTRQLDTSVGASGPHDFAVRLTRRSSAALSASTASRPAAVTIACRPLWDGTAADIEVIWVRREQEYFCERGWTRGSLNSLSGKSEKGQNLLSHPTPRYLQSSAAKRQDLAGTNGLHTSFLMASVFRSRLLNCGWSMSACDSLADSNHTRRHVRKVPKGDVRG